MLTLGFILIIPRQKLKDKLNEKIKLNQLYLPYIFLIIIIVAIHLIEVNFIDPWITDIIGYDYAEIFTSIEGTIVASMSNYWNLIIVGFFVIIYIIIYPFTLWFSPIYFIIDEQKKAIKTLAYGLTIIYTIALPFYLFLPATNVYYYNNISSALNMIIPSVEEFFYTTTTSNNTFPSLHVAMSIMIYYSVAQTNNQRYKYFTMFSMITVIISVIYLAIHWIVDVLAGMLISITAILIMKYILREDAK